MVRSVIKKTKTCIKERIVGGIILYQVARAENKGLFEEMSKKRQKYLVRYQQKCSIWQRELPLQRT